MFWCHSAVSFSILHLPSARSVRSFYRHGEGLDKSDEQEESGEEGEEDEKKFNKTKNGTDGRRKKKQRDFILDCGRERPLIWE